MKKWWNALRSLVLNRGLWTCAVVAFIFYLLIQNLYQMQIVDAEKYKEKVYEDRVEEVPITGVRGNIYDCYGRALAVNQSSKTLYYRADSTNEDLNDSIRNLLMILETNGDELQLDQKLPIAYDSYTGFYYEDRYANPTGTARLNFLAEIYGTKRDELTEEQAASTAETAFMRMRDETFKLDASLPLEMILEIMKVRYSIFQARWTPEEPVLIAKNISEGTQVSVLERNSEYKGFYVETEYSRVYPQGEYFAHILGYVGRISESQWETYEAAGYAEKEIVGKTGLEAVYEEELRGGTGTKQVVFDGKTGERIDEIIIEPATKGNDIILTMDLDIQKNCYDNLYKQIKTLLLDKITGDSSEDTYSEMDVLCALIENGFFNIDTIKESDNEIAVKYTQLFNQEADQVLGEVEKLIMDSDTLIDNYTDEEMDYFNAVMVYLRAMEYLSTEYRDEKDPIYVWYSEGKTTAKEFIEHCYVKGYFATEEFDIDEDTSTKLGMRRIIQTAMEALRHDEGFEHLVFTYVLRKGQIKTDAFINMCYALGFLDHGDGSYDSYRSGQISLLNLIRGKIESDEITPSDVNLDPSTGSIIMTDCDSGEVRAVASYPSFDNNLVMNSPSYYARVAANNSSPMLFRALMEARAPGSTFKMCTAATGLELGYINTGYYVYDYYAYPNVNSGSYPTCWSKISHGSINIVGALRDSCNYFFYDLGYRLSDPDPEDGSFKDSIGLEKIAYYTETLGLSTETGIELTEAMPKASDQDAVRSAIGQGTNNYTVANVNRYTNTIANGGTVYNLYMVDRIQDPQGNILFETQPQAVSEADVTDEHLDIIRQGMRLVNTESAVYVLGELDEAGITTAGKTGTAQESKLRHPHSWYTGYTNIEDPEITITVNIPYGNGSDNALPVFRDVVKEYYKVPEKEETDEDVDDAFEYVQENSAE